MVNQKMHLFTAIFSAFETVDRGQCSLLDKAGASTATYPVEPHARRLGCARITAESRQRTTTLHCNF
jgi:hypothetical protein